MHYEPEIHYIFHRYNYYAFVTILCNKHQALVVV